MLAFPFADRKPGKQLKFTTYQSTNLPLTNLPIYPTTSHQLVGVDMEM
jgi:hypothetical protein